MHCLPKHDEFVVQKEMFSLVFVLVMRARVTIRAKVVIDVPLVPLMTWVVWPGLTLPSISFLEIFCILLVDVLLCIFFDLLKSHVLRLRDGIKECSIGKHSLFDGLDSYPLIKIRDLKETPIEAWEVVVEPKIWSKGCIRSVHIRP